MTKVRISIRYKFLILISFLLVGSVFAYLGLASHVFTKDKTQLVYDYNRSYVTNISSELSKQLESSSGKMKLAGILLASGGDQKYLKNIFEEESNIANLYISRDFNNISQYLYWNDNFFAAYGLSEEEFKKSSVSKLKIPWQKIKEKGSYIWDLGMEGVPVFGFAKVVLIEGLRKNEQFVVLASVRLDHLAKSLQSNPLSELFIINSENNLIFADKKSKKKFDPLAISDKLRVAGVKSSVFEYEAGEEIYLSAYSKAYDSDLIVLSRASKKKALSVVERFVQRSILFASIVFTIAFIVAILFSRSLTRPLESLLEAMKKVAKGNLSVSIKLRTKDEISLLADNFNQMIRDLRGSRQELEDINKDLENKVKERTVELEEQNKAVKDAQEALLKTSRLAAAGEIAGRAAHEVLNPLTSILTRLHKMEDRIEHKEKNEIQLWNDINSAWNQDLKSGKEKLIEEWNKTSTLDSTKSLLEEDLDNLNFVNTTVKGEFQEIQSDLGFLLSEGRRINKIVQSMRSLNRTSGEKLKHTAYSLISESFKIMADSMDQHNINFHVSEEFKTQQILVDKDEFIQAVTNLIRNSIYALKDKNIEKRIIAEPNVENGILSIHIIDNGEGISSQDQEKLFESNFSTKSSKDGTGLGLSISRRFMRSFDGDLELHSSIEGEGCNFKIKLPLYKVVEEESA